MQIWKQRDHHVLHCQLRARKRSRAWGSVEETAVGGLAFAEALRRPCGLYLSHFHCRARLPSRD